MNLSSIVRFLPLLLASALLAPSTGRADTPEQIPGTTRVDAETLIDIVGKDPDAVIIDARTAEDRTGGYVEGSLSLPDTDATPQTLSAAVPDKATAMIVYCNGVKCGRSVVVAKLAVAEGYAAVYWFRGGWDEWVAKGLPVAFD